MPGNYFTRSRGLHPTPSACFPPVPCGPSTPPIISSSSWSQSSSSLSSYSSSLSSSSWSSSSQSSSSPSSSIPSSGSSSSTACPGYCYWIWNGTNWNLLSTECSPGCTCYPPGPVGEYIGQILPTICQTAPPSSSSGQSSNPSSSTGSSAPSSSQSSQTSSESSSTPSSPGSTPSSSQSSSQPSSTPSSSGGSSQTSSESSQTSGSSTASGGSSSSSSGLPNECGILGDAWYQWNGTVWIPILLRCDVAPTCPPPAFPGLFIGEMKEICCHF